MGKLNQQNAAKDNVPNKLRVTFTAPYMGFAAMLADGITINFKSLSAIIGLTNFYLAFCC